MFWMHSFTQSCSFVHLFILSHDSFTLAGQKWWINEQQKEGDGGVKTAQMGKEEEEEGKEVR